jgi:DnaJ-class molecular chaperone
MNFMVKRNLKPCPFCGGKASESYNGEWRYITCSVCYAKGQMFDVRKFGPMGNQECYDECARVWNQRWRRGFVKRNDK